MNQLKKLYKDKRGLELRFLLIGMVLFSGVFALMVLGFQDVAFNYDATNLSNPEIEERYNQLAQQQSLVQNVQDSVSGEEGLQLLNVLGTIFTGTVGVLNLMITSITFIPDLFVNFASDFGIPKVVTQIFFTIVGLIITILIIFAILNALRR